MRKRVMGMLVATAAVWSVVNVTPSNAAAASLAAPTGQKAVIQTAVKLRAVPSSTGDVVGFMKQGEAVTVLEKTNSYWYKVKTAGGITGYTSSSDKYIKVGASSNSVSSEKATAITSATATTNAASAQVKASAQTKATVQTSIRLRSEPSTTTGDVLGYLNRGDVVTVTDASNVYWFKVATSSGLTGYMSSSAEYVRIGEGVLVPQLSTPPVADIPSLTTKPASTPSVTAPPIGDASDAIDQVISTGKTYLGTPYEYGSDRNSTATFDCSAFIRQIFQEAISLQLPGDSRSQGEWIKQNSQPYYDLNNLKRGDLLFFTNYSGSPDVYATIDKSTQTITHVALYLGDNKLLHTFSVAAGGVKITDFSKSWQDCFLFGGSVLPE